MPGHSPGNSHIAVCYAGWMNVNVPERGATARRHLVDVLDADVFLAGTFLSKGQFATKHCKGKCLLKKVSGLAPFTSTRMDPMLSRHDLFRLIQRAPHWDQIKQLHLGTSRTDHLGTSVATPHFQFSVSSTTSQSRGPSRTPRAKSRISIRRVVWSRLEYDWLASILLLLCCPGIIHVPPDQSMSDRHAVMDRLAADDYFRRWELLHSTGLPDLIPWDILMRGSPEYLLLALVRARRHRVASFPCVGWSKP